MNARTDLHDLGVGELASALEAFLSHFDGVMLSDLVRPRRTLRVKLDMVGARTHRGTVA